MQINNIRQMQEKAWAIGRDIEIAMLLKMYAISIAKFEYVSW